MSRKDNLQRLSPLSNAEMNYLADFTKGCFVDWPTAEMCDVVSHGTQSPLWKAAIDKCLSTTNGECAGSVLALSPFAKALTMLL